MPSCLYCGTEMDSCDCSFGFHPFYDETIYVKSSVDFTPEVVPLSISMYGETVPNFQ